MLARLACLPLGLVVPSEGAPAAALELARDYADQGHFTRLPEGLLPPLHRVLLAPALDSGEPWPGVMLLNLAADLAAALLLMAVARRRYGPRAGAAAGWIVALQPSAVLLAAATTAVEPFTLLAGALLVFTLDGLDRRLDSNRRSPWPAGAAVGLAVGLGVLVDELLLLGVPVAVLVVLLRGDVSPARRLGLAALVVGLALAVPSPWAEHNRRAFGSPVLSGTSHAHAALVANAPPGENGELLWAGLPDVSARLDAAREVRRRSLLEYPELTAARLAGRVRLLLGPEIRVPAWIAAGVDGAPPSRGDGLTRARFGWLQPSGSAGRVAQLLGGLGVLLLFALAAGGVVAAAGDGPARTAWLAAAIISMSALLGSASDADRQALLAFVTVPAALALDLATQREPVVGRRAQRALAAALVAAGLLTTTLFLLPPP